MYTALNWTDVTFSNDFVAIDTDVKVEENFEDDEQTVEVNRPTNREEEDVGDNTTTEKTVTRKDAVIMSSKNLLSSFNLLTRLLLKKLEYLIKTSKII